MFLKTSDDNIKHEPGIIILLRTLLWCMDTLLIFQCISIHINSIFSKNQNIIST